MDKIEIFIYQPLFQKNKMGGTILKLRNVWKIYQMGHTHVDALHGLSLEVKKGEFLMVQGPSGSGKTTALNSVGCLDVPTRGSIFLEKENIAKLSEASLTEIRSQKIGFVFQRSNLIPTLNALENVALPMIFQNVPKNERTDKAKNLLSLVKLSHRLTHRPSELSAGELQRVAIARSLANDPEVILADEPTGNLDSKTGITIMNLLKELNKQGKTIILVTHDQSLSKYADRIVYLRDGKISKEVKK